MSRKDRVRFLFAMGMGSQRAADLVAARGPIPVNEKEHQILLRFADAFGGKKPKVTRYRLDREKQRLLNAFLISSRARIAREMLDESEVAEAATETLGFRVTKTNVASTYQDVLGYDWPSPGSIFDDLAPVAG